MRLIEVDIYVGLLKATENSEKPLTVISATPFGGTAFDSYRWFRTTMRLRCQEEITETDNTGPHEVSDGDRQT